MLAVVRDSTVLRNIGRLAEKLDLKLTGLDSFKQLFESVEAPTAIVIELEIDGALEAVKRAKARWTKTLVAGFVSMPTNKLWHAGEEAGCDLVSSRGSLARQLEKRLQIWKTQPGGRRIRLFSTADIAGRLGVVQRLPSTPAGPLAIYHIGGEIYATQDTCPHAGGQLSKGELNMGSAVITCPNHGSQFKISNGERVRGPSDEQIKTYQVVVEGTQVFLQLQ